MEGNTLEINYKSSKLEKICTLAKVAQKTYGSEMAEIIAQRIAEIEAIDSVEEMIQFKLGRCHRLKGNRKNQYAVYLIHPFRLIFKKDGIENQIQIVKIIEIADYH